MAKHDAKGRTKNRGERFAGIPLRILYSAAYRSLPPVARALLVETAGLFNGYNNGSIGLSHRDAARLLGVDQNTAARALRCLVERRLISATRSGYFSLKSPHATEWRLTWMAASGEPASNEWKIWKPSTNDDFRRLEKAQECNLQPAQSYQAEWKTQAQVARTHCKDFSAAGEKQAAKTGTYLVESANCVSREMQAQIYYHTEAQPRWAPSHTYKRARNVALACVKANGRGSQRQLAAQAGLSEARLSRILADHAGRRRLRVCEADRLEQAALRMSVAQGNR